MLFRTNDNLKRINNSILRFLHLRALNMNATLIELMYFILPLALVGSIVKFAFKANVNFLLPSAIMLLLFIVAVMCSSYTSKEPQSGLFTIFWIVQLVGLIGGIVLMFRQEIVAIHFLISLPFQLYYWIALFYYGGLIFTHKFDVGVV